MPKCKQCGKEFKRERDTKAFCRATCRSLYRYHKNKIGAEVEKEKKDSVQIETVSVQREPEQAKDSVVSVQEEYYNEEDICSDEFNPEF